jgi:hypothetical protein
MNHHKPGQHGPTDGTPHHDGRPDAGGRGESGPLGEPKLGESKVGEPKKLVEPNPLAETTSLGKPPVQRSAADALEAKAAGKDLQANKEIQANKDIQHVLRGWEYEAGTINVRKISGADGKPKLQMRLDLGLLQMEMTGRPDGREPHGFESLLEYHEQKLAEHHRRRGTDDGFEISSDDCQALREEAVMYYQRYLSLFVLEEFAGVVRDTARNLQVLDLCGKFGEDEEDRMVLEQYRPYITMMNARAKASIHVKIKRYREALRDIDGGLTLIREFFDKIGRPEAYDGANEVKVLKRFAKAVRKKLPVDPVRRLQKQLDRAVKDERYEAAARFRDKLAAMKGEPEGPQSARA